MKTLQDAAKILEDNLRKYQNLCKNSNDKVFNDIEAFFRNLNPFNARHHGGETGFHRAQKFLLVMENEIRNGNITCTKNLLDFAIHYSDKGRALSEHIYESIMTIIELTDADINPLILRHQSLNPRGRMGEEEPSFNESKAAIINYIVEAIQGIYNSYFFSAYLDYNFAFSHPIAIQRDGSVKFDDTGTSMLNHLKRNSMKKAFLSSEVMPATNSVFHPL